MATVNDVTKQIDKDGQYPEEDKLKVNALNELYEQYRQFKGNKTFIEWLEHYATAFNQGPYNGYSREELVTAARTHANDYPVINGITNGTKTLTQEGRAGDSTSVNERSNRDLPSDENGITNGETAENAQQPTTNTTESSTIGANPEDQEDITPPPAEEKPLLSDNDRAALNTVVDIANNLAINNEQNTADSIEEPGGNRINPQEEKDVPPPVREKEEDITEDKNVPPSSNTTTTSTSTSVQEEKTPTPAPTRTNTPVGQPAEMVARSGIYEQPEAPAIRPVDRGRFDYIRNNGWGSNSSILTRMGYSQDEIRRILDSSGAVRPEYFSY